MVFILSVYLSYGSSNLSLILSYQIYAPFIFDIWDLTFILQFFKWSGKSKDFEFCIPLVQWILYFYFLESIFNLF